MGELYQDRSHSYDAGGDEPEAGEVERGRHVGEGAPGGDAAYHSRDAISMDDGQAQPLALCESRIMTAQSFDDGDGDDAMREPRHGFKDGQPKDDDGDRHAELDLRDGHGTRHRDGEYHGYNGDGSGDGGHGGEAYGHGEYEGTGGYAQGDGYDQGYGDDRHMGLGGQQRGDDGAGDIEISLHVSNLDFRIGEPELRAAFEPFGTARAPIPPKFRAPISRLLSCHLRAPSSALA
uniref:Uncharacterized protein n=2 Tax=Chrysotila carterae TaxID=13221 RepID=A0A7S4ETL6_CHRCT